MNAIISILKSRRFGHPGFALLAFVTLFTALRLPGQTIPAMPVNFPADGYMLRNADLAAVYNGDPIGAWEHYYRFGVFEGRRFDVEFHPVEYLGLYGDLNAALGSDRQQAVMHWFLYGKKEGRMGGVPIGFDHASYLARYPDVAAVIGSTRVGAWLHFINYGVIEGRTDGEFNPRDYLTLYGDLAAAFGSDIQAATLHWYLYGRGEGRRIPAGFSVQGYLARNPDVRNVVGYDLYGAWLHYLNYGVSEGRIFDDNFRVDEYLQRYADLRAAFGSDRQAAIMHWIYYGRNEGRVGRMNPAGPPVTAPVDVEASRFLIQATFGPDSSSITRVKNMALTAWIDEQISLPATYHMPYFRQRVAEYLQRSNGMDEGNYVPRQEAWWQNSLMAPDQLRQRMAFALSQILVISEENSTLSPEHEGVMAYYDMLIKHSFGNYRQLLEEVTLSPMMGTYLSMIRNRKPNPTTGAQPDENYAREIMQLFSIGLTELNLNGTPKYDSEGLPLATYTQTDIVGLAHVFTGWGPHYDPANPPKNSSGVVQTANNWFQRGWDPLRPMSFNANYGDLVDRTILGGVVVPGTMTGPQRMKLALDTIFNHPNVGPFIGKQLIQRFVTSNPSPAYVQRVAEAFNNNGVGIRGDLSAVIRAVLLDPEARDSAGLTDPDFGKLTEPLLRMTRIFRAFPLTPRPYASANDNRMFLNYSNSMEEQSPLFAPTVFNFYKPGFAKPGAIENAGLVSPEFQIYDDVVAMLEANRHYSIIHNGINLSHPVGSSTRMRIDLTEPLAILSDTARTNAQNQALLVDYFNQRLLGGTMSTFLRQKLIDMYAAIPTSYAYTSANNLRRIQIGLYLVMFSPEFNIHR